MLITLPFNSADAAKIRAGDLAAVFIEDHGLALDGYVRKVMSGQSVSATGALITNVEIVFANPGALSPGAFATAVVGDYACNDLGQTEYAAQDTIYAAGSGKVSELTVNAGDRVSAGQKILSLENSSVDEALSRAGRTVTDAEKKLTNTQNNLQIKSPIAGTVLTKSAKAGDTLYNTSTTLAVVADMSCLTFTIDVDELEIRYVQAGQQATVTADAYEGETFAGLVTNVGKTGAASNGVTTYPVTIEIAEYGGLLPGMNVNADIVVREALDVLFVPVDAVTRGNLVLVKDDGSGAGQEWPQRGDGQDGDQPPLTRGEGQDGGQGWPQRGEGQDGGQDRPQRGDGQGGGQDWPQRGDGQDGGQGWPQRGEGQDGGQDRPQRGDGQGGDQPPLTRGDGQDGAQPNLGFMGAQAPEGYVYRRVETGISDSNFVEIVSGLNEGDIIAYRPAARDSGNMNFNMFMGPGGGGGMTYVTGPGGSVMRQDIAGPGGR
jgi:multidrug efflux pump subunit AcrA (membrane-fusion protein)